MATLSEQERRQVLSNVPLAQRRDDDAIVAAVEEILTARLAKVEALADECASSDCIHLNDLWGRLRAALASDPTHTQDGGRR